MAIKKRSPLSERKPNGPDPLRFCRPDTPSHNREAAVAIAAYLRARERHFEAGHELEDWLAAEAEFDRQLKAGPP